MGNFSKMTGRQIAVIGAFQVSRLSWRGYSVND